MVSYYKIHIPVVVKVAKIRPAGPVRVHRCRFPGCRIHQVVFFLMKGAILVIDEHAAAMCKKHIRPAVPVNIAGKASQSPEPFPESMRESGFGRYILEFQIAHILHKPGVRPPFVTQHPVFLHEYIQKAVTIIIKNHGTSPQKRCLKIKIHFRCHIGKIPLTVIFIQEIAEFSVGYVYMMLV